MDAWHAAATDLSDLFKIFAPVPKKLHRDQLIRLKQTNCVGSCLGSVNKSPSEATVEEIILLAFSSKNTQKHFSITLMNYVFKKSISASVVDVLYFSDGISDHI